MNVNHLTKDDKKRGRYIKSLLILHEIEQQDVAIENDASEALVSYVVRGHRKGVVRNGKKIAGIKQSIANKLGMPVKALFPDKAA